MRRAKTKTALPSNVSELKCCAQCAPIYLFNGRKKKRTTVPPFHTWLFPHTNIKHCFFKIPIWKNTSVAVLVGLTTFARNRSWKVFFTFCQKQIMKRGLHILPETDNEKWSSHFARNRSWKVVFTFCQKQIMKSGLHILLETDNEKWSSHFARNRSWKVVFTFC